jgi:hypothetical protein
MLEVDDMSASADRHRIACQSDPQDGPKLNHGRRTGPWHGWAVLGTLLASLVVAGCNLFDGRPEQVLVHNYTDKDIVIVHRDDNGGGETVLKDSLGNEHLGPGGTDLFEVADANWCSRGSFIARTTDGVEVERVSAAPGFNLCSGLTVGSPPPSASPSPAPTPTTHLSPSSSAGG